MNSVGCGAVRGWSKLHVSFEAISLFSDNLAFPIGIAAYLVLRTLLVFLAGYCIVGLLWNGRARDT